MLVERSALPAGLANNPARLIPCQQLRTASVVTCIVLPVALQLSQAHTDHKKLRDQYSAEILARNADLASLEAAEQRAAQLQDQLTAAQDASTQALAAQQRAAEQAAASVAAAAAARSEAEGRCARLQSQLDGMTAQLRQLAEAQAGGFALTAESEYTCCCADACAVAHALQLRSRLCACVCFAPIKCAACVHCQQHHVL
jgi:hypothetical protein